MDGTQHQSWGTLASTTRPDSCRRQVMVGDEGDKVSRVENEEFDQILMVGDFH